MYFYTDDEAYNLETLNDFEYAKDKIETYIQKNIRENIFLNGNIKSSDQVFEWDNDYEAIWLGSILALSPIEKYQPSDAIEEEIMEIWWFEFHQISIEFGGHIEIGDDPVDIYFLW